MSRNLLTLCFVVKYFAMDTVNVMGKRLFYVFSIYRVFVTMMNYPGAGIKWYLCILYIYNTKLWRRLRDPFGQNCWWIRMHNWIIFNIWCCNCQDINNLKCIMPVYTAKNPLRIYWNNERRMSGNCQNLCYWNWSVQPLLSLHWLPFIGNRNWSD